MKWRYTLIFPGVLVWSSLAFAFDSFSIGANNDADILPVEEAFELSVERTTEGTTWLTWHIAPGYYLYQQQLTFSGLDEESHPALPAGLPYSDEFFGDSQVYRDSLQLTFAPAHSGAFTLGWQGCADAGLCYPPQTRDIDSNTEASQTGPQSSQIGGHLGGAAMLGMLSGLLVGPCCCW